MISNNKTMDIFTVPTMYQAHGIYKYLFNESSQQLSKTNTVAMTPIAPHEK